MLCPRGCLGSTLRSEFPALEGKIGEPTNRGRIFLFSFTLKVMKDLVMLLLNVTSHFPFKFIIMQTINNSMLVQIHIKQSVADSDPILG